MRRVQEVSRFSDGSRRRNHVDTRLNNYLIDRPTGEIDRNNMSGLYDKSSIVVQLSMLEA